MPEADVSVVVPTRNRWDLLPRTLRGALGQHGVAVQVVVVDDSTDDATERGLAALEDPRVHHVRGSAQGVSAARNLGVAEASAQWVAFLDDDDLWAPGKLLAQLRAVGAGDVWVYAAAVQVDPQLRVVPGALPLPPAPGELNRSLVRSNCVPAGCSNVVARRSVLASIEGFDPQFSQVADWDVWLQLAEAGPAAAVPEHLVGYMQHSDQMLQTGASDPFAEWERLATKHRAFSRRVGQPFSRPYVARWVAMGHRRAGRRWDAVRLLASSGAGFTREYGANVARAGALALGESVLQGGRSAYSGTVARPSWLDLYAPTADG